MSCNPSVFQGAIDTLEEEFRLLERPHAAELKSLVARKEAIAAKLADAGLTVEQVSNIRDLTARNQARLSAVSRGTAEALKSLRAFKSGRLSTSHYAPDGRRSSLEEEIRNVVKRA